MPSVFSMRRKVSYGPRAMMWKMDFSFGESKLCVYFGTDSIRSVTNRKGHCSVTGLAQSDVLYRNEAKINVVLIDVAVDSSVDVSAPNEKQPGRILSIQVDHGRSIQPIGVIPTHCLICKGP